MGPQVNQLTRPISIKMIRERWQLRSNKNKLNSYQFTVVISNVNLALTQIVIHEGPDGKLEKQGGNFDFNLFSIPSTQFKSTDISRHTFVLKVPQEPRVAQ